MGRTISRKPKVNPTKAPTLIEGDWRFSAIKAFDLPEDMPGVDFTIWTDVPITRRQSLHQIFAAGEAPIYHATTITECLEWLYDQEARKLAIVTPFSIFLVELQKLDAG